MAFWACAQIQPQREQLALHCLKQVGGFEVYSPRIRPVRRGSRCINGTTQPLFLGYCFVSIIAQWHAARWQPGVVRLVMDGVVPARVPDQVIADLRERERNGVIYLPERKPRRGDVVRVLRGPFRELVGLYAGMKPRERVEVLLSLLGQQTRIELARADIDMVE
jgi:transcriptional antiterminator RfaH